VRLGSVGFSQITTGWHVIMSDGVRERLKHLHDIDGLSWREIAQQPEFKGIPPGSLCSFYKGTWEPKDNETRRILGLTEFIIVESKRNHLGRFTEVE